MPKRDNAISREDMYMIVALVAAKRSKDPNTQVGCVIVSDADRILSIGYNGFPNGCSDDEFPWEREGEFLNTKYPYVVHAELNAILNSIQSLSGCTIYVSLFPCNECAKAIIQSGIRCVVYESDKYSGTDENIASKKMFRDAGVELVQLTYQTHVDVQVNRGEKQS